MSKIYWFFLKYFNNFISLLCLGTYYLFNITLVLVSWIVIITFFLCLGHLISYNSLIIILMFPFILSPLLLFFKYYINLYKCMITCSLNYILFINHIVDINLTSIWLNTKLGECFDPFSTNEKWKSSWRNDIIARCGNGECFGRGGHTGQQKHKDV